MGRHLAKLFDSLCKLEFPLGDDRKPLKVGLGMHSKEDEYVHFDQECDLSGQVSAALEGQRGPLAGGCRHGRRPVTVLLSNKSSASFLTAFSATPRLPSLKRILRANSQKRRGGEGRFLTQSSCSGACGGAAWRGPEQPAVGL